MEQDIQPSEETVRTQIEQGGGVVTTKRILKSIYTGIIIERGTHRLSVHTGMGLRGTINSRLTSLKSTTWTMREAGTEFDMYIYIGRLALLRYLDKQKTARRETACNEFDTNSLRRAGTLSLRLQLILQPG
jgi:hypothetical protein